MSQFTILYWIILNGIFFITIVTYRIISQNSVLDSILLALKTILLSTTVLWGGLQLSYKRLSGIPSAPDFIGSTAGFPLEAFKYPVASMGHDVPPVDQWSTFFLNFGIIHLVLLIVIGSVLLSRHASIIYQPIKAEKAEIARRNGVLNSVGLLFVILILNAFFLNMVSLMFD